MPKLKKKNRILLFNEKFFFGILICTLLILSLSYVGRGWLRTSAVNWYANTFYMHTVNKRFTTNFSYVNDELYQLGINFDAPYATMSGCGSPQYEGVHLSLGCIKEVQSGIIYDDEQFNENWMRKAHQIQDNLLSKGWTRINDIDFDIANLLNPHLFQPEISYSKEQGKITCSIRIGFNKYDTEHRRVFAEEYCGRGLEFFGGY